MEIGFTYEKRAKIECARINYKNYPIRSPCNFLNDDLNVPTSPFLHEQIWSFTPFSGMGQVNSRCWPILAQWMVVVSPGTFEETVANPRRAKNGRNIFQVLKMVLCRIFPLKRQADTTKLTKGKWKNFNSVD